MLVLREGIPSQRVNWTWDISISELGGALDILLPNPFPSPCQWQNEGQRNSDSLSGSLGHWALKDKTSSSTPRSGLCICSLRGSREEECLTPTYFPKGQVLIFALHLFQPCGGAQQEIVRGGRWPIPLFDFSRRRLIRV